MATPIRANAQKTGPSSFFFCPILSRIACGSMKGIIFGVVSFFAPGLV